MDKTKVIYSLIEKWFKDYNYLFTLTEDYNSSFISFVFNIVQQYLKENNLTKIDDDLLWAHIRFILGNTYKKEIEIYKLKRDVE